MFRFEDPTYFYLFSVVPLLIVIWLYTSWRQRRKMTHLGDAALIRQLMPEVSKVRPNVKLVLILCSYMLLVTMLARPQMGAKVSNEKRNGIETIIALDVSNSMRAEDVAPSRLDKSKMLVEDLVDNFSNDKIGLLVFAGEPFVQLPITSDYVSAKMFLSSIEPGMIATQGTDIASAIKMATQCFTKDENVGKAIIIITDGEDHEGGAEEAAKEAKKAGMKVYMLGVGSTQGTPIPDPERKGYMQDREGNTVMSALNDEMCRSIAAAGGGAYIHVDNTNDAQRKLNDALSTLARKNIESVVYSEFDEQFQAFGVLAIILLVIEVCILKKKNPFFSRYNLFTRKPKATMLILVMLAMSISVHAQITDRQCITVGNKHFRNGDYAKAEIMYRKALDKSPNNTQAIYNLANSLVMQKKDSIAIEMFEKAAKMETSPIRKSKSYHNIGVICQTHQMYGEAIEAYKKSLRLNPKDDETRYNLALCKKQQKKQDNNKDKSDQNDKGNDKEQQQKNQNDKKDKDNKKDEQKPPKEQMSKENAEQMLNAAIQQEKNTQQRLKKADGNQRRQLEKNW